MTSITKIIGSKGATSDKEEESKFGLTVLYMKDGGKPTKPTARADSSTPTETSTMESGLKTKPTVLESTVILTVHGTKACGRKTSNTGRDSKPGQMAPPTKEIMLKAASTASVALLGLMVQLTMDNSQKTT